MSEEKKGKGSWEEAEREYKETFLRTYGVGFFTFDTPQNSRINDAPTESNSIENARTSFRTMMTFLTRKRIGGSSIFWRKKNGDTTTSITFQPEGSEEIHAGNELLGEVLYRFMVNDESYFHELLKLKKSVNDDLPMKSVLYQCAVKIYNKSGVTPTREQVLQVLWNETDCRPTDTTKLFKEAKLGFLKGKRGRPKKNRNP